MSATSRSLPQRAPRTEPESASRAVQVRPTPDARTDGEMVSRLISGVYALGRDVVEQWGGQASMAAFWGMAESNLCQRLNRREVNGTLNYAFVDWFAIAGTHPAAAARLIAGTVSLFLDVAISTEESRNHLRNTMLRLVDALGYDPPKRKKIKTEKEKLDALVEGLKRAGELGEAAIRRAAADIGADPSEYGL
jgi:hypothetical protein